MCTALMHIVCSLNVNSTFIKAPRPPVPNLSFSSSVSCRRNDDQFPNTCGDSLAFFFSLSFFSEALIYRRKKKACTRSCFDEAYVDERIYAL